MSMSRGAKMLNKQPPKGSKKSGFDAGRRFSLKALMQAGLTAVALTVGVGAAAPAHAVNVDAARKFVEITAREVLDLITAPGSDAAKQPRVRNFLQQKAAVQDIARVVIGNAWRTMSGDQRRRYVAAFTEMLTRTAISGFKQYSGETVQVIDAKSQGRSGVFVTTRVLRTNGREPVNVTWRIVDRNGPLQVADVYLGDGSLLVTQRSKYAERLDALGGDIDKFIAEIEAGKI